MPKDDDDFKSNLQRAVMRLMHLSMGNFRSYAREKGLSFPQLFALRHVRYKGECNISDIGDALGVSNAAASQMLDKLVQQGLLERRENPTDRRNKILVLTESGDQILQESFAAYKNWIDEFTASLSESDIAQLQAAFELILIKTEPLVGSLEKKHITPLSTGDK